MHPLRDSRFRALVVGQAVNGIGSWCALIAIWGYAAERFDAEPWQVAVLGLTWTVPGALLGPLAGIPTDRFDPRRVLIAADLASAAMALAMAASNTYWSLVVFAALQSFAKSFAHPAFGALTPRIVADEQLAQANSLLATSMQASIAFGPLLGAAAIGLSGARGAFIVDALTYLVGVGVTIPLQLSLVEKSPRQSAWREAVEGLQVVRERPVVMRLFAVAAGVYVLWGSGVTLEPLYVKEVLRRSPETFAYLQTVFGIALVLVGLLVSRFGERAASFRVLSLASIVSGISIVVYLSTSSVVVAFAGIAIWGCATPWFVTPMRTLLQRSTPMEMHGRVFAVDETLRNVGMAISTGSAGLVFQVFGARVAAVVFGSVAIVGGVFGLGGLRAIRDLGAVIQTGPSAQNAPRVDPGAVSVVPGDL